MKTGCVVYVAIDEGFAVTGQVAHLGLLAGVGAAH